MQLLNIDGEIENMGNVLNNLDMSCSAIRRVRDTLTNEEAWNSDSPHLINEIIDQGLLLAAVIRHMEQLIDQGHKYEFARRRAKLAEGAA